VIRLSEANHRDLAFWGMALIALGLPLSTILMSVGQFVLIGNWLLEGDIKRRLRQFFTHRLSLVLSSVWFIHLVGMAWAPDLQAAWRDVQVKLPLLILPLVFFTSKLPEPARLRQVLYLFVLGTVAGSLVGMANYLGLEQGVMLDKRNLSYFTSHIRFGMMVVFSLCILAYFLFSEWRTWPWAERIFTLGVIGWLFWFTIFLESATAYAILASILALALLRLVWRSRYWAVKLSAIGVLAVAVVLGTIHVRRIYLDQTFNVPFDEESLALYTANGVPYQHETTIRYVENGHRVWNNICWMEVQEQWPKRSSIPLRGRDMRGEELHYTLLRYMSSLGLPKDSLGISKLTDEDVRNIEHGHPNHKYVHASGITRRLAQFFWEVNEFDYNRNPNSSSLIQRWVYTKVGLDILRQHWMHGVGTEGLNHAYVEMYQQDDRNLFPQYQLIAHNQFLSTAICLGLFGGIWFAIAFFYPLVAYWRNFLYLSFMVMMTLSFLSDNTLGTQSGVTLYAFMNALLIAGVFSTDQQHEGHYV